MPNDHYLPQVYQKKFCSDDTLLVINKINLRLFSVNPSKMCGRNNGNTNNYLNIPRLAEDFLRGEKIESDYNNAVDRISSKKIDERSIQVLSGLIASIHACSPLGMSLFVPPLTETVIIATECLEKSGEIPKPPSCSNLSSLTSAMRSGEVQINIDQKFPQALGIINLPELQQTFSRFRWEFLVNADSEAPFLSSDFPFALESNRNLAIKIFPLSTELAVRLVPAEKFECSFKRISAEKVKVINRSIVQVANEFIFYQPVCSPWIRKLVGNNQKYSLTSCVQTFRKRKGSLMLTKLMISKK